MQTETGITVEGPPSSLRRIPKKRSKRGRPCKVTVGKDSHPLALRVSDGLYRALIKAAATSSHSINDEIRYRLAQTLLCSGDLTIEEAHKYGRSARDEYILKQWVVWKQQWDDDAAQLADALMRVS